VTRLLVDGMNVIGSRPDGWWRDRDGAVRTLADRLSRWARDSGAQVTVVFDGRPLADLPEGRHGDVEVAYARRAGPDAADDRIVELAGPQTVVVTSDRDLRARAGEQGAEVHGVSWLHDRLDGG
jgi:predicted RNA-binding protein with PIN domain